MVKRVCVLYPDGSLCVMAGGGRSEAAQINEARATIGGGGIHDFAKRDGFGKDVDLREHALQKYCCKSMPYPAPRCGLYRIECRVCGLSVAVTVAGRADDPRSVVLVCKPKGMNA